MPQFSFKIRYLSQPTEMHLLVEEVDHLLLAEPEGDVAHLRCGISILKIFGTSGVGRGNILVVMEYSFTHINSSGLAGH